MKLVVDLGGTNLRAALAEYDGQRVQLHRVETAATAALGDPGAWLRDYLDAGSETLPDSCEIAVAGPLDSGVVTLTNAALTLQSDALSRQLGLPVRLCNDFAAVARAVPVLDPRDWQALGEGTAQPEATILVLGPGTGMGVAGLVPTAGSWAVVAGEGGHAGLANIAGDAPEVCERLYHEQAFVCAEDLLCGRGLERLYRAVAASRGAALEDRPAAAIAQAAFDGRDEPAAEAVRLFTRWLGRFAGDLALIYGARGGVYLAGGILPAWGDKFDAHLFRLGFEDKGAFSNYVAGIATRLIEHPYPALLGLAATP